MTPSVQGRTDAPVPYQIFMLILCVWALVVLSVGVVLADLQTKLVSVGSTDVGPHDAR